VAGCGQFWVAQIIQHREAKLNPETRAYIQDVLFRDRLDERKGRAEIQWHWV
jgi:hypothetical protein